MAPTGGFDAAVVIAVGEGEVVAEAVLVVLVVAEELCEVLTISESYVYMAQSKARNDALTSRRAVITNSCSAFSSAVLL